MRAEFDPSYEWLGIRPEHQPPHHYRLLGLEAFETDPAVIENAAKRQRLFVETFCGGSRGDHAQTLLNQIAMAKACLLDPSQKDGYDASLRNQLSAADQGEPRWLYPGVIAGVTAVSVLTLLLVLAFWGYAARRNAGEPSPETLVAETPSAEPASSADGTEQPAADQSQAADPNSDDTRLDGTPTAPPVTGMSTDTEDEGAESPDPADSRGAAASGTPSEPPNAIEHVAETVNVRATVDDQTTIESPPPSVEATEKTVAQAAPLATAVSVVGLATSPKPLPKSPEPNTEAKELAREQLMDAEGDGFQQATTPADKQALAEKLLGYAREEADHALRFVLLDEAVCLAADAGDSQLPKVALSEMERRFDADMLSRKADVVKRLVTSAKTDPQRQSLARLAVDCGDQASSAERFVVAEDMFEMGLNFARRVRDAELQKEIHNHETQLAARKKQQQDAEEARQQLAATPDDPDANLTLGRYLCFRKEEWDDGLPHLFRGRDPDLVGIAGQETADESSDDELVVLADAWYEWGSQADGDDQRGAWSRAQHWYRDVRPRIEGPRGQHVDEQLAILASALSTGDELPPFVFRLPWLDGPSGELRTFEGHTKNITALAVSRTGTLLASAAEDRTVRVWSLLTGRIVRTIKTETANLNGVAFTPDDRLVASNFDNAELRLWSTSSGKMAGSIPTSARSPSALAIAPDGQSLVWAIRSRPPNILVWNVLFNQPVAQFGHGDFPSVLDVSNDGRLLVTGDSHGTVRLWDLAAGAKLLELTVHKDAVTDIDLSPDGGLVASATFDQILITDLKNGTTAHAFDVPSVRTVVFSPDGRRFASGGKREQVYVWDLSTMRQLDTLRAEAAFSEETILHVAFLPDPRGLVTGATGGNIRLWKLPD
ncbi:MAG: hypothetical protein H8E44_31060 [Planctomycetes bacterium]|nr:hypothetical protein [Planctomycetota bacterium]MBL7039937.1 hypothetical protein [Pirellulaceae bacterium]